jgi:hypothetical protein
MKEVTVDIVCPKCSKKALFHSEYVGTYKLYPKKEGKITCVNCGLNGLHIFSNKDYYYQIPVGNRILYAGTKDYLIFLKNFFREEYKHKTGGDSELDFPRIFYLKREEIVKKINSLLEKETECR